MDTPLGTHTVGLRVSDGIDERTTSVVLEVITVSEAIAVVSDLLNSASVPRKNVRPLGCYFVGRVVAPFVSFGRWKCDRMTADIPRQKLRKGGLYHLRGRQVYLTVEATALVGFLFVALLVGAGIFIWYLSRT